ncbi:hypothetical protein HN51_001941, partial [Arachis hypogaea]
MVLSSTRKEKKPPIMALTFLLMLLHGHFTTMASASRTRLGGSACLKVSPSEFVGAVREVIGLLGDVASILSRFSGGFGNFRLANAILDCLDLLDMSSDELNWSVSATQNPKGKNNSTGNLGSDLKTWLSAALANPETCLDGFEGTSSIVKGLVSSGLGQVTSLVKNLLAKVDVPHHDVSHSAGVDQFPSWVKPGERKLLQANGVAADAVVALDGSGKFTRVMDAIMAAPDYSMKRFVIYVKRGVYNENVEIKKKKWNIMMIGDGIGATVITGNRSVVDGWTTFRSATF